MPQGISSHGTIIEFKPAGSSTWTEIAEIGDIQMPGFTRNEFDITSHNRDIDAYVLGVLRRDPVTFPMFFNKAITSQGLLTTAVLNGDPATNMTCGFRITAPDTRVILFSGGVKEMKQTAPVDGVQTANVTIRATGEFWLDGVLYGA